MQSLSAFFEKYAIIYLGSFIGLMALLDFFWGRLQESIRTFVTYLLLHICASDAKRARSD